MSIGAPKFIAFGNALVDMSVKVDNDSILKRFNFGFNEQGECEQKLLDEVMDVIRNEYSNVDIHAGGSAINTCRILSELGENNILFNGSVGDDLNGRALQTMLNENNVATRLRLIANTPTGSCICLIYEDNRCCFANIGASIHFPIDYLSDTDNLFGSNSESKKIFYIEGFFVSNRFAVCQQIYERYCGGYRSNMNIFASNLSADYMIHKHTEEINYLSNKSNILFGNRNEFDALAKVNGFTSCTQQIHAFLDVLQNGEQKICIVTNGSQFVDIFILDVSNGIRNLKHEQLEVEAVDKEDIVDTTGAGDSFVAGFFYAFLREDNVLDCVRFGISTASQKIRVIGAKLK